MSHKHLVLHLTLIKGVGPQLVQKLIERKPTHCSWDDYYAFSSSDFQQLGISEQTAQLIVAGLADQTLLARELTLIEQERASYCTILDDAYPALLKEIHLPPPVIYYYGVLPVGRSIAFVGSRGANQYGERAIEQFVPELVSENITIVSGGAIGADSMVHRAAIAAGGKTVAVLGSGLCYLYPYRNKKLFADLLAGGGAIISSFSMQSEPYPAHFVSRNRVIAGLSDGVVVVQAAQKSGTRITAQFALEQGRDVFAVPGSIDDPLSAGCHALIQEGAKITSSAQDILNEYGLPEERAGKPVAIAAPKKDIIPTSRYAKDSIQAAILSHCVHAQSMDDLVAHTDKSMSELQGVLFDMQLAGHIEQDFTGLWRAN